VHRIALGNAQSQDLTPIFSAPQYLGLKTPDASHLLAAQYHGCKAFWTNDDRLQKVVGPFAVKIGM